MSAEPVTAPSSAAGEPGTSLLVRAHRMLGRAPLWALVLGGYVLTRLWGWVVFSVVAREQGTNPWHVGRMGYLQFIGIWDSDWYRQIAEGGYPQDLPVSADGTVRQNRWAFYPLFPLAARGVSAVTGLDFVAAGSLVSLLCGAMAALLLYGFFATCLGERATLKNPPTGNIAAGRGSRTSGRAGRLGGLLGPGRDVVPVAAWATALVLLAPVSAILQVPYAESMNLMFLAGTLWALVRDRWWICALLMIPTCLSRPVGVPLAAALGLWWLVRVVAAFRERRRVAARTRATGEDPVESVAGSLLRALRRHLDLLGLALFACLCALSWVFIAWAATGRSDAYTATETAWRGAHLLPIQPWFQQAEVLLGDAGWAVLLLLGAVFVWAMGTRAVRSTLPEAIRLWCYCYLGYLVLFLFPQSSTFRLLLPVFPLAAPLVAVSDSRAYRVLLLVGAALGQLIWVGWLWHWKQLPGGGDFPP